MEAGLMGAGSLEVLREEAALVTGAGRVPGAGLCPGIPFPLWPHHQGIIGTSVFIGSGD